MRLLTIKSSYFMKKQILFCATFLILVFSTTTSCSTTNDDAEEIQSKTVNAILKTEKMLNFESSLKVWFQSLDENGISTLKNQSIDLIKNQCLELLTEIGVNKNEIESKIKISDDALIMFTLEQYSKKLSESYQQKNK